jgi:hypothetical protein
VVAAVVMVVAMVVAVVVGVAVVAICDMRSTISMPRGGRGARLHPTPIDSRQTMTSRCDFLHARDPLTASNGSNGHL